MKSAFNTAELIIYTDGSCHTQKRFGAWVAIVLFGNKEVILKGSETDTTHHRMELLAVINAIEYVYNNISSDIVMHIVTDSQYVVGLPAREHKLSTADFRTKSGKFLQHADLVKSFYQLLKRHSVVLKKVKAHQPTAEAVNYNEVADQLAGSIVRAAVS